MYWYANGKVSYGSNHLSQINKLTLIPNELVDLTIYTM